MTKCYPERILALFYRIKQYGAALALFVLLLSLSVVSSSQPPEITDSIATFSFYGSPESLQTNPSYFTGKFSKSRNNNIDFRLVGDEYKGIVLKLASDSNVHSYFLCIDNTSLDTVNIYRLHGNGQKELLYSQGSLIAFDANSNYVWHTVPLQIETKPSYYLIAVKAAQKNINLTYEIVHAHTLQRKYQAYERFVFFYTGVVGLIAAIIIVAFILFKKGVFVAYLGYIACFFCWTLSHYGRIFPFVYPDMPVLNQVAKPVSSLGACFFLIVVLRRLFAKQLAAQSQLAKVLRLSQTWLAVFICAMLLLLLTGLPAQVRLSLMIAWHVGLILSACLIVFTPILFYKSGSTARIFSIAMVIICLTAMIQLFGNLGFVSNYFINEHGITVGSLFEISIMAFGIFYGLLEEMKQKEGQLLSLEQEQTDTLKKLITVQDNERKRIAGDLHDNIGPLLAALKINFRRIVHSEKGERQNELAAKTESIIDDSIAEIRNIAHNLMPKGLSTNGLINTLNEYFQSLETLYNKKISFEHKIGFILTTELQINVYRSVSELVLNAARHSNATQILVNISGDNQKMSITIRDDGQGFHHANNSKKSLGLQNAEDRVLYMKGKFCLKTEPAKGTVVDIEIPL